MFTSMWMIREGDINKGMVVARGFATEEAARVEAKKLQKGRNRLYVVSQPKTYKIRKHTDLPIGEELFLGPSHAQYANRYLRRLDGMIEVQHIYRHGKTQPTQVMTPVEFDAWQDEIAKQNGA